MAKKKTNKKVKFSKAFTIIICTLIVSIVGIYFAIKNLNYGLDLQGGFEVLYKVDSIDDKEVTTDMVTSTYKIIEKRTNALGVSEPEIAVEGNNIRVTLAGVDDIDEARKTISSVASLTFRDTDGNLLMDSTVLNSGKASVGYETTKGYYITLSVADYDKFYSATKKISKSEEPYIVIWLDYVDGTKLVTSDKLGVGYYENNDKGGVFHRCGDLANSACLSYAGVSQGFASDVIIQGNFSKEEAQGLVDLINSGSMPTKLTEIQSKTVTASFGENSLNKTFIAGIVGIGLIIVLLIFLYHFSGFIASISMLAYTFLTLTIFNLVGGRLSLQGIAALVIGIGMAVDSNVISFSRIKEELKRKVSLKTAFLDGSKESFSSILDANITTLIAAVILFIFGESSVKGFATMLIISIVVTFIAMVFINRYILNLFVKTEKFENHKRLFINYKENKKQSILDKINFVNFRKVTYIIVGLILVCGSIFIFKGGLNLGIDFKGGSNITIKSTKVLEEEKLQEELEKMDFKVKSIEMIEEDTAYVTIENILDNDKTEEIEEYFNKEYDATTSVGSISNQVKKDLTKNAIKALIIACIGMIIYTSIRFKFSYALSAIVALIHDSLMVLILFSILKLEVNSMFIAAILSIIGYSINNTIVIFDRIRENKTKLYKDKIKSINELENVVNVSLKQTINRCLVTTITTLIPVVSLIFLGSYEIINFNLALLFGLVFGTLSSLFLSSQVWIALEKKNIGKDPTKHWYDDKNYKEKEELKVKGINC